MEELLKFFKPQSLIIVLLAGIGVTNVVNIKLSTDPSVIRPDAYTGSKAKADNDILRAELAGQIQENRDDVDVLRHSLKAFREEQIRNTLLIKLIRKEVK